MAEIFLLDAISIWVALLTYKYFYPLHCGKMTKKVRGKKQNPLAYKMVKHCFLLLLVVQTYPTGHTIHQHQHSGKELFMLCDAIYMYIGAPFFWLMCTNVCMATNTHKSNLYKFNNIWFLKQVALGSVLFCWLQSGFINGST